MRGLSQELVIALIFGAIWLAQWVYRQLRRKLETMPAQDETELPPVAVAPTAVAVTTAPRRVEAPLAAAPMRVAPRTRPPARRFSRAALMSDRRAVQDAIVIAAILQPCHANRARDFE